MKPGRTILTAVLLIVTRFSYAATPEEESRFLAALREAFLKKDKEALVALSHWDRVPPEIKKLSIDGMGHVIADPIKSIEYGTLEDAPTFNKTMNGITYVPNLPITKEVRIVYESKSGTHTGRLFVGEKAGRLLIVNLAPQQ